MTEIPDIDMNDAAYVFASKHRLQVVLALNNRQMTQKHLGRMLSVDYSNIGRSLRQLIKWKLVTRLSPGVRKGALYTLSKSGKAIMEYIESNVDAYNNDVVLEPHEYEVLVTVGKYMVKVMESGFYAWNWDKELNNLDEVAEGRL
jgi:predicted transcriptional regulator